MERVVTDLFRFLDCRHLLVFALLPQLTHVSGMTVLRSTILPRHVLRRIFSHPDKLRFMVLYLRNYDVNDSESMFVCVCARVCVCVCVSV